MQILVQDHLKGVAGPENIRINDQVNTYREECRKMGCSRPYHHFAFGQSPFSPPPTVVKALAANASQHSYLPTAGMVGLRELIAVYYNKKFGIDCGSEQVIIGPGSKEMISTVLTVLQGTLIVPVPSWVSYLPQAKIIGKEVISIRTKSADGFKLTPDLLLWGLEQARSKQTLLLLNNPNNPTGAVYSSDELKELTEICRKRGVVVISDEIYAQICYDPDSFTSMARIYPEGTIVTGGLSKDRSCGGYRFGLAIAPRVAEELIANTIKVAGSTYSCVAAPIQHAAMEAYSLKEEVEEHIRDCTKLHALAGRTMSSMFSRVEGVRSTVPQGAFYLYADFNDQRERFAKLGFGTCRDLCQNLLTQEHTALLPGSALLLPEDDFSVRCSFVDYDGDRVLANWRADPPLSAEDEKEFASENFTPITGGVASIARYMRSVREGKRPDHFDDPAAIHMTY